jgi:hypothetical protein
LLGGQGFKRTYHNAEPETLFGFQWLSAMSPLKRLRFPMASQKRKRPQNSRAAADDFKSVAKRLGCDEDKGRFEAKLRKIAKVKPKARNQAE